MHIQGKLLPLWRFCMKKHKKILPVLLALFSLLPLTAFGQAGSSVFAFMDMPMTARLNALGGSNVSIKEGDVGYIFCNPALLNEQTDKVLQLNYAYYLANINFGSALYGHNYKDNYFAAGIHVLDYGTMQMADEYGRLMDVTFKAQDILIDLAYAKQLGPMFTIGVALKPIYSTYDAYSSFALGADIGGHFQTKDKAFQLGLVLQNIGWQLKGFYSAENGQALEKLPLNLQLGWNYRFKHAPIRISMTIHNLQRWNLNYQTTNKKQDLTIENSSTTDTDKVQWYDMIFRHTIFAIDIVPKSDRFYITLSYNHRRRMEMHLEDQRSFAGFAIGGGVKIYKFRVGFTFSQYLKGQYVYQVTLSTDINDFLKK